MVQNFCLPENLVPQTQHLIKVCPFSCTPSRGLLAVEVLVRPLAFRCGFFSSVSAHFTFPAIPLAAAGFFVSGLPQTVQNLSCIGELVPQLGHFSPLFFFWVGGLFTGPIFLSLKKSYPPFFVCPPFFPPEFRPFLFIRNITIMKVIRMIHSEYT